MRRGADADPGPMPRGRAAALPCLAVALSAVLLAGCGGLLPVAADGKQAAMFSNPALSPQAAQALLVTGQSTRADIAARLGPAQALAFDSGYQVWVYRAPPPRRGEPQDRAELVLLFGPDGVLRKQRLRPAGL